MKKTIKKQAAAIKKADSLNNETAALLANIETIIKGCAKNANRN